MYALFFAPNISALGRGIGDLHEDDEGDDEGETERSTDDANDEGDMLHSVDVVGDCGAGVLGRSIPCSSLSNSASLISSSVEGKKLRKSASACHLLAFRNSTHTSMRPGRLSAGSRRSRWFVVAKRMRPSEAATPSRALSRPERERVLTSLIASRFRRLRDELGGAMGPMLSSSLLSLVLSPPGVPVESESRVTLRVKAASRSSSRTMQRAGTRDIRVVRVPSEIHDDDSERV